MNFVSYTAPPECGVYVLTIALFLNITLGGNGMYLVSYTAPPKCGVYALTIALEGKRHIYNSPFPVFVIMSHGMHVDHCSID